MSPRVVRTAEKIGARIVGKTAEKIGVRIVSTIAAAPVVMTTADERTIGTLPVTDSVARRTIDRFVTG
jgi:hypothetical protein